MSSGKDEKKYSNKLLLTLPPPPATPTFLCCDFRSVIQIHCLQILPPFSLSHLRGFCPRHSTKTPLVRFCFHIAQSRGLLPFSSYLTIGGRVPYNQLFHPSSILSSLNSKISPSLHHPPASLVSPSWTSWWIPSFITNLLMLKSLSCSHVTCTPIPPKCTCSPDDGVFTPVSE